MASTTKAEARKIAKQHANTALQFRDHLAKYQPGSDERNDCLKEALKVDYNMN